MSRLTKTEVKALLGLRLDSEVAEFFGISQPAVSQWGEDDPIPELRQLQLEVRRPDLFADSRAA